MSNLKKSYYFIFGAVLALGFSLSLQSLLAAWVAPPSNPPEGNTVQPLNTGKETQTKGGGLILNTSRTSSYGLVVSQGYAKIGNSSVYPLSNPKLQVDGMIHTTNGGIRFPNGTIQTTAASSGSYVSCNWGGYGNYNIPLPSCLSCSWPLPYCLSKYPSSTHVYCSNGKVTYTHYIAPDSCCSACGSLTQYYQSLYGGFSF